MVTIADLISSPSFVPFILGFAFMLGLILIWKLLRYFYYWWQAKRYSAFLYSIPTGDDDYASAVEIAKECKRRLRFQKSLNPRWIEPLVVEVPVLIKEIANVYYPNSSDPVMAPGISQFARAIQLIAGDIASFLEGTWLGRRIDVSGTTARQITSGVNRWRQNRWLRGTFKAFDRLRPAWQAIRYNSPIMWGGILTKNVGIRYLQPKIIDIVARRSIELYSGQLSSVREELPAQSL